MIRSFISSFFLTNLSPAFPLVSLIVSILSIFLLLDKARSQPKSRSLSSSVIHEFNEVIAATLLLIHIDTLSLPMSHFLRTFLSSLPHALPILMSYHYLFSTLFRIPHLSLQLLHLNPFRFIIATRISTLASS